MSSSVRHTDICEGRRWMTVAENGAISLREWKFTDQKKKKTLTAPCGCKVGNISKQYQYGIDITQAWAIL